MNWLPEGIYRASGDRRELRHKNPSIQSGCLRVLYEVGCVAPEWIADYAEKFLRLLESKNSRIVWVTTIALDTITGLRPREICAHVDDLIYPVERGSLVTVVWGFRALAKVHSST